jgi:hypothetical protein
VQALHFTDGRLGKIIPRHAQQELDHDQDGRRPVQRDRDIVIIAAVVAGGNAGSRGKWCFLVYRHRARLIRLQRIVFRVRF